MLFIESIPFFVLPREKELLEQIVDWRTNQMSTQNKMKIFHLFGFESRFFNLAFFKITHTEKQNC